MGNGVIMMRKYGENNVIITKNYSLLPALLLSNILDGILVTITNQMNKKLIKPIKEDESKKCPLFYAS